MTVKVIDRVIAEHYQQYQVVRTVGRAKGSRANALWAFLFPDTINNNYAVFIIALHKERLVPVNLAMRISAHVLARVHQRTTQNDNLSEAVHLLRDHVGYALTCVGDIVSGQMKIPNGMNTYTAAGKLIWVYENGRLHGKTWVSADQFGYEDHQRLGADGVNYEDDMVSAVIVE